MFHVKHRPAGHKRPSLEPYVGFFPPMTFTGPALTRLSMFHVKHPACLWATLDGGASPNLSRPGGTPLSTNSKASAFLTIRGPSAFAAAFNVSRETLTRLETYEALLRRWQKAVNLVAPATLGEIWHRHFADSAQLLAHAPPGPRHWIDLGSGGGFPGMVIAILLADPRHRNAAVGGSEASPQVSLIESDARKAAFLREVARQTAVPAGVPVNILATRVESARIKVNGSLPRVICARALAPLERLLALAAPLSPPGTTGLFLKGKSVSQELQAAEKVWNFDVELVPSVTDRDGRIAVITRLDRKAKD